MIRSSLYFCVAAIFLLPLSACGDVRVGGYLSSEIFSEPNEIALANAVCRGRGIETTLDNVSSPDIMGDQNVSILLWAIGCESLKGVEALLEAGADPNFQVAGESPVTLAVSMQDSRFLKLLLENGGDANAIVLNEPELYNALSLAFRHGVDNGEDWTNYYLLLDAGADINQQLESGDTIASWIAVFGRYCKLVELFDRGYTKDLYFVEKMIRGGGMSDSDIYVECRTKALERIEGLRAQGYN